jgi:deazaflavin-dependent oxidoreductase (nitroreductase family)
MLKRIIQIAGGLFLAFAALSVLFMVGMRTKYAPVTTAVRRFNRAVTNPRAMRTAGEPGAMASAIRHVGRTSGTPYETPIGPVATDDGFVVPLPYGLSPDWLKNVLAAGSAIIVHEGAVYAVTDPEIIPASGAFPYVPLGEQRALRAFAVDQFLRVRREEPPKEPE